MNDDLLIYNFITLTITFYKQQIFK